MNDAAKITIIVIALAGAGFLLIRSLGGDSGGSLEGKHVNYYICSDPECGTEFAVKPGESIAPPESKTEICPECRSDWPTLSAKCESCGRMTPKVGHGTTPEKCAHCGEAFKSPRE